MKKPDQDDRAAKSQRRARIERLLFTGATLATTALALSNPLDPKIPPFVGE